MAILQDVQTLTGIKSVMNVNRNKISGYESDKRKEKGVYKNQQEFVQGFQV